MTKLFNIPTLSNNTETILSDVFSTLCLVKVSLLHKKDIVFQPNIILGVLFPSLLSLIAIKLPRDKADIEESIAFVGLSCNVYISKYKNHNWNYWNQFYIDSKNCNGGNKARCQTMKILIFIDILPIYFAKIPLK